MPFFFQIRRERGSHLIEVISSIFETTLYSRRRNSAAPTCMGAFGIGNGGLSFDFSAFVNGRIGNRKNLFA
jgi:hypothetical protein